MKPEQTTLSGHVRKHKYTPMTSPPSPFIKWAGGKRSIMEKITSMLPSEFNTYHEPFIGGGAVLFSLAPPVANISDYNADLVTTYNVVKNNPNELISALEVHKDNNSKEYFYTVRAMHDLANTIEVAARFIYLNRTCFNGLFRVNKSGEFNVPFGSYKNPNIVQRQTILACHRALQEVTISHNSYIDTDAASGDFVYFDPPYYPENEAYFTSYTKYGFSHIDHVQLRDFAAHLCNNGVQVMLSNSNTQAIRELYELPQFTITEITAPRRISCDASKRVPAKELIITGGYDHETGRIYC